MTEQSTAIAASLDLTGAGNARDLGGYRTAEGRTLRSGTALRADALTRLTDEDLAALARLGVRTVVDLRGLNEVEENGADRLPPPDGVNAPVRAVSLPVYDAEHDIYTIFRDALTSGNAAAQQALLGNGAATRRMTELYVWFVTDAAMRAQFAEVVRLLADPEGVPLLFHCTAGKDRTGWAAAVVLTALGVDRESVYADYLVTNARSAAVHEAVLGSFRRQALMEEPELILPILRAEPGYLDAAFAAVEAGWPSFEDFLADGLGLDATVLVRLRANLLLEA